MALPRILVIVKVFEEIAVYHSIMITIMSVRKKLIGWVHTLVRFSYFSTFLDQSSQN